MLLPSDLQGRATVACATFAAEIAVAMAESSLQLANATGSGVSGGLLLAIAWTFCTCHRSASCLSGINTTGHNTCILVHQRSFS